MRWSETTSPWIRNFTSSLGRMIPSEESATFRDHAVKPGHIYTIFNAIFGPTIRSARMVFASLAPAGRTMVEAPPDDPDRSGGLFLRLRRPDRAIEPRNYFSQRVVAGDSVLASLTCGANAIVDQA